MPTLMPVIAASAATLPVNATRLRCGEWVQG
jgi:hypothetical protein